MNATAHPPIRLLLLEDSQLDADLIEAALRRDIPNARITHVETGEAFSAALGDGDFDLILSDYSLPTFDGFLALQFAQEKRPDLPFVFVSGVLGEEVAIESLRRGATDYVLKQRLARLPAVVRRAVTEATERAERKRAEERLQLLVAELSHRVKNTLATVLSIAHQTLRSSDSLESFEPTFTGRIMALSEAHGLLFKAHWHAAPLEEVIDRTFAPLGRRRGKDYEAAGPAILLNPRTTLTLGMVLHELAANAIKYGAFSAEGGRVAVSWTESAGMVSLDWRETGGPAVGAPSRRGFGTRLMERSASYELGGSLDVVFAEEGLQCRINFPITRPGQAPLTPDGRPVASLEA